VYKNYRGFSGNLRELKDYSKFPAEAKRFVSELERAIDAKCALISLGKSREETLVLDKEFSWLK
jgi:adenylosuccinate synthase